MFQKINLKKQMNYIKNISLWRPFLPNIFLYNFYNYRIYCLNGDFNYKSTIKLLTADKITSIREFIIKKLRVFESLQ